LASAYKFTNANSVSAFGRYRILPEEVVDFGTVQLDAIVPENDAEQRRIIFDTMARVQGIESSGDPLREPRASLYLASGRRRRGSV
jgi:catalase